MPISTSTSPAGVDPRAEVPLLSLLVALSEDYPDLDRHQIARAVEDAAATAEVLGPGLIYTGLAHVEMLARDRLDVAARRMAARSENAAGRGRR